MTTGDDALVECYSGHTYAQEPRAFSFGNARRTVAAIRKRWREPAGPCFEVLADDGVIYALAYREALDQWHVSAQGPATGCDADGSTTT